MRRNNGETGSIKHAIQLYVVLDSQQEAGGRNGGAGLFRVSEAGRR